MSLIRQLLLESETDASETARVAGYTIGPVWHGTPEDKPILVFRGTEGAGWFAPDEQSASMFGTVQGPFWLNLKNPASRDAMSPEDWAEYQNAGSTLPYGEMLRAGPQFLRQRGYDGMSTQEGFMVISPGQVKSAAQVTYDNDGNEIPLDQRFNPSNPDIRY